jgi:hypothetical protein
MPYRAGLHTMVELLADFGVWEGRRVTIEIVNGTELRFAYDPPLSNAVEPTVSLAERRLFGGKLH